MPSGFPGAEKVAFLLQPEPLLGPVPTLLLSGADTACVSPQGTPRVPVLCVSLTPSHRTQSHRLWETSEAPARGAVSRHLASLFLLPPGQLLRFLPRGCRAFIWPHFLQWHCPAVFCCGLLPSLTLQCSPGILGHSTERYAGLSTAARRAWGILIS